MEKKLSLERIIITELFGRFSYNINLKNGYDVSILIAPNGCGKTTIFNIVSFMFHPTTKGFSRIADVPFKECECYLSNGKIVKLCQEKMNNISEYNQVLLRIAKELIPNYEYRDNADEENQEVSGDNRDTFFVIDDKKISLKGLIFKTQARQIGDNHLGDGESTEYYPAWRRFENVDWLKEEIEKVLEEAECNLGVNYVAADRLHIKVNDNSQGLRGLQEEYDNVERIIDPIEIALRETRMLFYDIREEYNKAQSEAKDKLLEIFLEVEDNRPAMNYNQFQQRWNEYVSNIEKYTAIGLLDPAQMILESPEIRKKYNEKAAFLCTYLAIFEEPLKPLEREYDRLKLFVDILNERNRITKKVFSYGREGIIVKVDGKPLPLTCLSSGEKNDFVMFYNLIFNSKEDGLVLIDEPEISLHIEWQEAFLDALLGICEMNGLQAVVATHSPNIVNGHFELLAEKGVQGNGD